MTFTAHFLDPRGPRHKGVAVASVPYSNWPIWAKVMKRAARPQDKGIGDVVARTIGPETSQTFKEWHKLIFGEDCGCTGRHAEWNVKYPLPKKNS